MSELLSRTSSESSVGPSERPSPKRSAQLGLSTLLLAIACIAAWGSTWLNKRQIERLEQRVTTMRRLTRELVVKDGDHLSIVKQQPQFDGQELWHVYVPDDSLSLHLVTRGVPSTFGTMSANYDSPSSVVPLTSGRHVVELTSELEEDQWITQVSVDDQRVMKVREPEEWNGRFGFMGSSNIDWQADLPVDRPAVLFHRVFLVQSGKTRTMPTEPSNGIILWIAKSPPATN